MGKRRHGYGLRQPDNSEYSRGKDEQIPLFSFTQTADACKLQPNQQFREQSKDLTLDDADAFFQMLDATINGHSSKGESCKADSVNMEADVEKLRVVVTWEDEDIPIIGHESVKEAIESAFLMANCLETPIDPSVSCQQILIAGVGGIGKSRLLKAMAVKVSKLIGKPISYYNVKSTDLLSKYIGDSEKLIKTLFDNIEKHAPSLVVFDEFDGLMKARTSDETDSSRRFKTTLLAELRGNRELNNVVIVASSNKCCDLDANLLGRFKQKFVLQPPSEEERGQMFEMFFRVCDKIIFIDRKIIDYDTLIKKTAGFSGNDIGTAVGLAAKLCLRVYHNNSMYKVGERPVIERKGKNQNPLKATMLPLTMDALITALDMSKPSISSKDVKDLNKWESKHCISTIQNQPGAQKEISLRTASARLVCEDVDLCCLSCCPF